MTAPPDLESPVREAAHLQRRTQTWPALARSAAPYLGALALVLPLVASEVWSGFRLGLSDPVLGTLSSGEQPLSVRSPGGQWAIGLALLWFGLAYWRRRPTWWQPLFVIVGGAAVLLRTGNAWLDALALIAPLGTQLASLRLRFTVLSAAVAIGLLVAAFILWSTRPPVLPHAALASTRSTQGTVFADWRWAPQLQRDIGQGRHVLAAGGLGSESSSFWLDYVRIIQDFERWPAELRDLNVDVVVLAGDEPVVDQVRSSADWHVVFDADNALVAERVQR